MYESQTAPLIDYYSKKGIVRKIDGTGTIPAIYGKIKSELEKIK